MLVVDRDAEAAAVDVWDVRHHRGVGNRPGRDADVGVAVRRLADAGVLVAVPVFLRPRGSGARSWAQIFIDMSNDG